MEDEIIYFSVNNWSEGWDYPLTDNFKKWLEDDGNQPFMNDAWAKENKLCIYYGCIDMSFNYNITAPRSWVEKNCPELLTDDEYVFYTTGFNGESENRIKYSDFVDHPDKNGKIVSDWGWPYLEYKEENFGSHFYDNRSTYR